MALCLLSLALSGSLLLSLPLWMDGWLDSGPAQTHPDALLGILRSGYYNIMALEVGLPYLDIHGLMELQTYTGSWRTHGTKAALISIAPQQGSLPKVSDAWRVFTISLCLLAVHGCFCHC